MALDRQSLYALLLVAGIFVVLGAYSLSRGGEELLTGALYLLAGSLMLYAGIRMYRERDEQGR